MNWTYSEQISISVFHILLLLMHLSVMSDVFIVGLCRSLFGSFDQFLLFLPYLWLISFSYIVKKYHVELKCHNLWETLYFIIVHSLFHRISFFFTDTFNFFLCLTCHWRFWSDSVSLAAFSGRFLIFLCSPHTSGSFN